MLIQLLTNQPQAIHAILKGTPTWVWALLAGLLALGLSQLKARQVSLQRIGFMPLAWLAFSVFGIVSAFSASGQLPWVVAAWLACMAAVTFTCMRLRAPAGTRYDAATQSFDVPGSWVPLLLILGIFMTKYVVGIELAIAPKQAQDAAFALPVAMIYGAFNGIFVARAVRLVKMSHVLR